MKIKIEKGVPMPKSKSKYPFREMEVGDSFELSSELVPNVNTAYQSYKRSHNGKFSIKKYTDTTHRCWRIE